MLNESTKNFIKCYDGGYYWVERVTGKKLEVRGG
jgi:hypothetical protein